MLYQTVKRNVAHDLFSNLSYRLFTRYFDFISFTKLIHLLQVHTRLSLLKAHKHYGRQTNNNQQ